MIVPSPMSFPGSRVLAGWWRELASFRPRSLWVGYTVLHQIQGSIHTFVPSTLGGMETLLLRFLGSCGPGNASPSWERLSLHPALLFRMLHGLAGDGLVTAGDDRTWKLTPQGLRALSRGDYERVQEERRVFGFVSTPDAESSHFVRLLAEPPPAAASPWPDARFDPAIYRACFGQTPEWKRRFGFPENVTAAPAGSEPPSNWHRLIVDHPMRVALVLLRTWDGGEDGGLFGFWIEPGKWVLQSGAPAFHLAEDWREVFPHFADDPSPDLCWHAWKVWCQPRSLPPADIERCSIELLDSRLLIQAPRRLIDRLQMSRSDALKGEAWLLLGEGPVRRAAVLEVAEAGVERRTALGLPANRQTE